MAVAMQLYAPGSKSRSRIVPSVQMKACASPFIVDLPTTWPVALIANAELSEPSVPKSVTV
jgi:hypothetical protein